MPCYAVACCLRSSSCWTKCRSLLSNSDSRSRSSCISCSASIKMRLNKPRHGVMPNPVSLLHCLLNGQDILKLKGAAIRCLLCYLFSRPLDQWCSRNVIFDLYRISWWTIMKHKASQEHIRHTMHPPVCLQAAASLAWICASTSACRLPRSKENFGGQSHAITLV